MLVSSSVTRMNGTGYDLCLRWKRFGSCSAVMMKVRASFASSCHISGVSNELPLVNRRDANVRIAVHFLLKDNLDRGVSSSSTYDVLGKHLAEYLRCKWVDIPDKFLAWGRI